MAADDPSRTEAEAPESPYSTLPPQVRFEDTVASHESAPPPDPNGGRDPETDFMLRYAN